MTHARRFVMGLLLGAAAACSTGNDTSSTAPPAPPAPAAPTPSSTPMTPRVSFEIGEEVVDRTHALPAAYAPNDLVPIGPGYEKGRVYELRREAAEAWSLMHAAALSAGIELRVVSAFRSFTDQQRVYENKVKRDGPDQDAVAAPGHSEHQLGTAIDIGGPDKETILEHAFGDTAAGKWLLAHAPEYGFAISYTRANQATTGYTPEPWHYRYVGSAARARHDAAINGRLP